jgi:hypothetical protein
VSLPPRGSSYCPTSRVFGRTSIRNLRTLAVGTLTYAASAFFAVPGLHQIGKVSFGLINPAKGFRLLEAEASDAELTPRGLHLVQHMVDCLGNIDLFSWF